MKNITKGNKVKKILDGVTSKSKLKGYVMFEDNWISENDKILYNKNGDVFSILDFQEIIQNILIIDTMPYESGYRELKFSCVKLDKIVNVGDVLYI